METKVLEIKTRTDRNRIKVKVDSQDSKTKAEDNSRAKDNKGRVETRIKMVEHKARMVKVSRMVLRVIRDNRIKEVNKVLVKVRAEDKPAVKSLRIIRTVIRPDKEMPITLRMDRNNSSLRVVSKTLEINRTELVKMVNSSSNSKAVNKDKCLICLELETKWDSRVSPVRVLILEVMVDNKVNKMATVR